MEANREIITCRLNNGTVVLAKLDKRGRPAAYTFANWTQAQRRADEIGGTVYRPVFGRVFYVQIK